nr:putative ribonuclease H-like domain-containing protein [Tanacetum cinerariifolium]
MKHYLEHTDYPIWEVIHKENGPIQVSTDTYGQIRVLPPKIVKRDFGVSTEDANQKFLRSLPSSWSQVSLIMRTKPGVDTLNFDDLYNNLRVFESDVKGSTGSSSSTHNVAFASSDNTNNTNEVNTAYGVSTSSGHNSQKESLHHTLMISCSNTKVTSCSKVCDESYAKLKKLYDEQKEQLEAEEEKEELKTKIENFQSSSKGLSKLLNSQMSAKDKSRLGYRSQIHDGVLSYENEVFASVFDSRFAKVEGMHAVPPHMIGNYMPPKSDFGIDESKFTYGPKQSTTSESDAKTSDLTIMNLILLTSTARKVNTARPKVNEIRPSHNVYKSHSPIRRPFNRTIAPKPNFAQLKVHTAKDKSDNPYQTLKGKCIIDSGCSRHVTRNKAYLVDYQDFNGGHVAFGGSKGQITGLACLIAKATIDESTKWHKRFSWVFFLRTQDKSSGILKDFIRQIESQLNQKVKTIRCDNGTKFKNMDIIELCGSKGIKKEYSNARTPQQNGVAERINRALIEAARTMLADSFLPNTFWAEAVSTACYVLNRPVTVENKANKTAGSKETNNSVDTEDQAFLEEFERLKRQEKEANDASETLRKTFSQNTEDLFLQAGATRASSTNYIEPKKISQELEDESWLDAMQEELLQFKTQQVWILVHLPFGKKFSLLLTPLCGDDTLDVTSHVSALAGCDIGVKKSSTEKDYVIFNPLQRYANMPSLKCFSSFELIIQSSTAFARNFKPPRAVSKGLRMLTPQWLNDHMLPDAIASGYIAKSWCKEGFLVQTSFNQLVLWCLDSDFPRFPWVLRTSLLSIDLFARTSTTTSLMGSYLSSIFANSAAPMLFVEVVRYIVRASPFIGPVIVSKISMNFFFFWRASSASCAHYMLFLFVQLLSILKKGRDLSPTLDKNWLSAASFPLRLCISLSVFGCSWSVTTFTFEGLALIPFLLVYCIESLAPNHYGFRYSCHVIMGPREDIRVGLQELRIPCACAGKASLIFFSPSLTFLDSRECYFPALGGRPLQSVTSCARFSSAYHEDGGFYWYSALVLLSFSPLGTDLAKITKKWPKPDKIEHEIAKNAQSRIQIQFGVQAKSSKALQKPNFKVKDLFCQLLKLQKL